MTPRARRSLPTSNYPVQYLGRLSDGRTDDVLADRPVSCSHDFKFGGDRKLQLELQR